MTTVGPPHVARGSAGAHREATLRDVTVLVEVQLPPGTVELPGAVIVRVEDVSRADAAARVVGEARVERDTRLTGGLPLRVAVPVRDVDERAAYAVRVHVDANGDGLVSAGDYVSTRHYPVLTRGHPDAATVSVRRV